MDQWLLVSSTSFLCQLAHPSSQVHSVWLCGWILRDGVYMEGGVYGVCVCVCVCVHISQDSVSGLEAAI